VNNRASLTAEYMALFRALESLRPASARLFADPYAAIFLREWRKWLYRAARLPVGLRFAEKLLDRGAPGARAAGIARTKWIDDEATSALDTAAQLVLLGAGFDMRAHRLAAAARATVFELDHPYTSSVKQSAVRNVAPLPREHVRYVGIDFSRQSVSEVLVQAGFDRTQPACFIWEGVTNYLAAEAIDSTFHRIRQTASGNILLFTYIDRAVLDAPEQFFGAAKLMARLQRYGEPWTFGWRPAELPPYLAARGFEVVKDLSVAEVWRGTGRSTAGTRGYEFYRLATAAWRG
jgi:methyltransferase (TIGR00027 family)